MTRTRKSAAPDAELNVQKETETDSAPLENSLGTSTAVPTSSGSVSGYKRAHDDTNGDHRPNDEIGGSDQMGPLDTIPNGSKRHKTAENAHASGEELVGSITSSGNHEPSLKNSSSEPPLEILYCTHAKDEESEQSNTYYSNQKYNGWSDPLKDRDERSISLFEIERTLIGIWQDKDSSKQQEPMKKDQWRDTHRHFKLGNGFKVRAQGPTMMRINDPVCQSVLKFLIKYDPGQVLSGFYIGWPWHILIQYYKDIICLRDKIQEGQAMDFQVSDGDFENQEIIRRIDLLLAQINDVYTDSIEPELQNHHTSGLAVFEKLWLLFKPGVEVFARVNGELAAFIVVDYHDRLIDPEYPHARDRKLIVRMWNLRLVAGRLVRHMSHIAIDEYAGSRLINTLPVFPSQYTGQEDEPQAQRKTLIERGKKYFNIINQAHAYMDHKGLTQDLEPRIYNGRVVIDSMSYVRYGEKIGRQYEFDYPARELRRARMETNSVDIEPVKPSDIVEPADDGGGQLWKKYNGLDPTTHKPDSLEDHHFLLLPQNIRGFSLRDKQWGPPGVGKTYTVECIADYTRQPVLSLSCSDIDGTAGTETKLRHWFDLAKAWDALILIDEADIFLTWRQHDTLHQNVLVETFLRTIESFSGLLFLTTNRIGQLDLAINSRIDVAIHFKEFDFESQKKLWLYYFGIINKIWMDDQSGVYIKTTVMDKFLADDWVKENSLSGREIRNAFKQSIKIARCESSIQGGRLSEGFKMKLAHLKQAISNCKDKTRQILEANRVNSELELAAKRYERQDGRAAPANADDGQVEP
ncbi:MAG: hypothetical protein Q9196_004835 [Gyalolechia fulgens]